MPGSMRQRGENSWNLRVYAGRDPVTGRKISSSGRSAGTSARHPRCSRPWWPRSTDDPSPSPGKSTVAALCREWLDHATPSFSPKTVETTRMYIEDPIIPVLGSIPVAKLTPADLDRFYRQLLEVGRSRGPYAPATIRRVHGIIRRALTQGVRWGWISHNPAIDASPPRVPMKELKPPIPLRSFGSSILLRSPTPNLPRSSFLPRPQELVGVSFWRCAGATSTSTEERCPSSGASYVLATASSSKVRRHIKVAGCRWIPPRSPS